MVTAPLDLLGRKKPIPDPLPERRVTVIEDTDLKMPELWLSVYVHGPEAGPNFNKLFARAKCYKAELPDDADIVVFTGSASDVDPALYGAKRHSSVNINPAVDKANLTLYGFCLTRGIPMVGICGGAQLLHVAQGGRLFQDVDNHNAPHVMYSHPDRELINRISSVHHQMCMDNREGGMEVIATSAASTRRVIDEQYEEVGKKRDIEAFWYREPAIFGVQGHPEYAGFPKYTQWFLKSIDHLFNENPDLCYRANEAGRNKLRLKLDILEQRALSKNVTVVEPTAEDIIIIDAKG